VFEIPVAGLYFSIYKKPVSYNLGNLSAFPIKTGEPAGGLPGLDPATKFLKHKDKDRGREDQ